MKMILLSADKEGIRYVSEPPRSLRERIVRDGCCLGKPKLGIRVRRADQQGQSRIGPTV